MPRRVVEMEGSGPLPGDTISIVVCTRDRPADLERCLEALLPLFWQGHEVIIVDNAPQTEDAARLVRRYPYRYLVEAEPGLNRARNRGLRAASRPIIAFTDDDCVPDPGWAAVLRETFSDPKVGAATGLVLPLELKTDAQAAFEAYCANRRIFQKRRYCAPQTLPSRAGVAGMGANMAFRRDLLVAAGGFDPRLDGGTPTLSGGDTDLFARLLDMGSQIAYLPEAVVWHRHPRDRRVLRRVIFGYGAGLFAFLTKRLLEARDPQALVTALRWFAGPPLKALWNRLRGAPASQADLVFYEALGSLAGPVLFLKARRECLPASRSRRAVNDHDSDAWAPTAVLEVELNRPFSAPPDLEGRRRAFVLLRLNGRPVGSLWLKLAAPALRAEDLNTAMQKDPKLVRRLRRQTLESWLLRRVAGQGAPDGGYVPANASFDRTDHPAPDGTPLWSVVICTRDRPADLERCLDALLESQPPGGEIIVVDNAPTDEAALQVASSRPVRYLREQRPGLNRARSRGAREARGKIVLYTDDDVRPDPNWITAMLEPFSNPRVAAVTGLVMPLELESRAQVLFEAYGGFGRGFERRVFDYTNLAPAAAGVAGAGASMAFQRDLLVGMGLFEAELDAGTVTETGGDSYAFYQLLAEGFQIVYNPEALVWHRHRRELDDLRATLASYSVGGFAFLTRCLLDHGDWQALAIAVEWLQTDHLPQLGRSLFGWVRPGIDRPDRLPLSLVMPQFAGIIRGIRAHFVARRIESRSEPAPQPVEQEIDPQKDPLPGQMADPTASSPAGTPADPTSAIHTFKGPAGRSSR